MENLTEKRELSSQEFKDILTGKLLKNKNYADFYESSHLFEYSILIQNCIISDSEILIENETLEYPIILGENTVIEVGFRCKNCYFEAITFRGAIFESSINLNGIFNKVDVENIYCKSSFIWESCTFKSLFLLENGRFEITLDFEECNTEKECNFKIENGIFDGTLTISGVYLGKINLSGGKFNSAFRIGNKENITEFRNKFTIKGGDFNNFLRIEKSVFFEDFAINNKKVSIKKFQVISGTFEENVILAHASIDSVTFFGGEFKKEFCTHLAQIKELYVTGGTYNLINIKEGELKRIVVNHQDEIDNLKLSELKLDIKEIKFQQSTLINAYFSGKSIYTKSSTLNRITFSSTSLYKDSVVQINEFLIKEIAFEYFINLGYISFNNILFVSEGVDGINFTLRVLNSDLGKTQFIDCQTYFQDLTVLEFSNSKMLDIFVSDTTLPKQIIFPNEKHNHSNSVLETRIRNHSQRELAFNQLKKVYENRGDIANSLDYHSKAMNARQKIIYHELFMSLGDDFQIMNIPKKFNLIFDILLFLLSFIFTPLNSFWNRDIRKKYTELINISINQLSNNHGASWQRGLFMTTMVTGIFYYFYCYLSGFQIGNWGNDEDVKLFWKLFSYCGDFLNPIQKDDIFKKFYPELSTLDFPKARI